MSIAAYLGIWFLDALRSRDFNYSGFSTLIASLIDRGNGIPISLPAVDLLVAPCRGFQILTYESVIAVHTVALQIRLRVPIPR